MSSENSSNNPTDAITLAVNNAVAKALEEFKLDYANQLKEAQLEVKKFKKQGDINQFIKYAPKLGFRSKDKFMFIKFYLYVKAELTKDNDDVYENLFKLFEAGDQVNFNSIDSTKSEYFKEILVKFLHEAPSSAKLYSTLGFIINPPLYDLLEKVRNYHCGPRDIPFDVTKAFSQVKYGITCDNVDAVKIHNEVVQVLCLFHEVKNDITTSQMCSMLLSNMDGTKKEKLREHLVETNQIQNKHGDSFAKYTTLESLLSDLKLLEDLAIPFETRCNDLCEIKLDDSLAFANKLLVNNVTVTGSSPDNTGNSNQTADTKDSTSLNNKKTKKSKKKSTGADNVSAAAVIVNEVENTVDSVDMTANFARHRTFYD